jgi:hypothetical protein
MVQNDPRQVANPSPPAIARVERSQHHHAAGWPHQATRLEVANRKPSARRSTP